jgi:hypothetical protein
VIARRGAGLVGVDDRQPRRRVRLHQMQDARVVGGGRRAGEAEGGDREQRREATRAR